MRKSRAKVGICSRCNGPKTGKGRKLCDNCREVGCSVEGCGKPIHANDLCKACHQRWWRAKDREENEIPSQFWYQIKNRYGITREEYEAMLLDQNNLCPLCNTTPERWCVDHNHETGEVRGLLCFRCNSCLEFVEDPEKLNRALVYLNKEEHELH